MKLPSFSIVINTYNRGKELADTLLSLRGLDYPDYEVIVVNGPSTDDSQQVIDGWAGKVKIRTCPEANLSMSRNIGIEAASGDIVAFLDDDAAPHSKWLQALASPYGDRRVGAVGGFTIDNSGVRFQVRKTVCDRYGNAFDVSPFFDERPLCVKGTPFYPSLLGTNSSFRRDVLRQIGGFDNIFAYLLDETDVCLRIVDAGYQVLYAPEALIFHQFAESHIRTPKRIPKTLYPSVVSKSYFIMRHGSARLDEANRQLEDYRAELHRANAWLADHSEITREHQTSLDQDVAWGIDRGSVAGMQAVGQPLGDLDLEKTTDPFLPFPKTQGLQIALVSQSFPPDNDSGIARWTSMMAAGFSKLGHVVHVIARSDKEPSVNYKNGYWIHRVVPDTGLESVVMADHKVPPNVAGWAAAVRREVESLKTFGLDVLSFPIWDVEGVAVADDPDIGIIMSLHTSYAMAMPFKPEWSLRPIYNHMTVQKIIRKEQELLERTPVILANSNAIIDDLTNAYSISFRDRTVLAPHGTWDPFELKPSRRNLRGARDAAFQVAYVGRFEPRKGIDVAARALKLLLDAVPEATVVFVGDEVSANAREYFVDADAEALLTHPRVSFRGMVTREELDDIYATCDTTLMPSRYESFGLVAIEAMAAGASVVALASGGLKEVVSDGVSGYLVPVDGNEADVCARRLIDIARDRQLRERLSQGARAEFENRFTVTSMVEQAIPAYEKAARRRNVNEPESHSHDRSLAALQVEDAVGG
ncbi:glycosyltransferase [Bosea sp. 117]|uniref:glycosyltransferase n=1 Tax=Bosea sp. 117 TaxID=1125973 RepID=UPI0006903CCE|nr:glycosyltransferase [Bosea sp. 117]